MSYFRKNIDLKSYSDYELHLADMDLLEMDAVGAISKESFEEARHAIHVENRRRRRADR